MIPVFYGLTVDDALSIQLSPPGCMAEGIPKLPSIQKSTHITKKAAFSSIIQIQYVTVLMGKGKLIHTQEKWVYIGIQEFALHFAI